MRRLTSVMFAILIVTLLLGGCGSDDSDKAEPTLEPTATPTPLPEPSPEASAPVQPTDTPAGDNAQAMIADSVQRMETISSIEMEISVHGYPVPLILGGIDNASDVPVTFEYARGVFVAPDRMSATVQINIGPIGIAIELVALDQEHYIRGQEMTQGAWIKEQIMPGFTPAALLSDSGGVPDVLQSIDDLEFIGPKDLDGWDVFHLRGNVLASKVNALTFDLISTQTGLIGVDVYITREKHELKQIVLHEPPPEGDEAAEPTTWTFTVVDTNKPVTITPPVVESE